jgi:hypothetical protein
MAYTRYLKRKTQSKTQKKIKNGGAITKKDFTNGALFIHDKIAKAFNRKPVGRGTGSTTVGQNVWDSFVKEAKGRRHDRERARILEKIYKNEPKEQTPKEKTNNVKPKNEQKEQTNGQTPKEKTNNIKPKNGPKEKTNNGPKGQTNNGETNNKPNGQTPKEQSNNGETKNKPKEQI